MGTPPIFLAGTQGERIESDTSISLCGLPLFFVGTLLVAPKLPAMLRDTAGGGGGKYFPRIYFSNRRPLYRFATPRNATGHGREEVLKCHSNNEP